MIVTTLLWRYYVVSNVQVFFLQIDMPLLGRCKVVPSFNNRPQILVVSMQLLGCYEWLLACCFAVAKVK